MNDPVVVRPARGEDAAEIAAILSAGTLTPTVERPGSPRLYAEAITRIQAAGGEVLVAESGGAVVGVCQLSLLWHLQHAGGTAAEIESMHVSEVRRGEGIGSALVEAAVAWARQRGCYRIQLTSNLVRLDAHRFYESNGFVPSHVGFKRQLS
jgi:GNAT superfamily N-acetyltransferase